MHAASQGHTHQATRLPQRLDLQKRHTAGASACREHKPAVTRLDIHCTRISLRERDALTLKPTRLAARRARVTPWLLSQWMMRALHSAACTGPQIDIPQKGHA